MGEFRIGRTRAQHSYPEPRRDTTVAFARNSAFGPAASTNIDVAGTLIPWASIEAGGFGVNVPITPKTTGALRIIGVVTIKNSGGANVIQLQVTVNGTPLLVPFAETLAFTESALVLPVLVNTPPGGLPVGVLANIGIKLTAGGVGLSIALESSTIDVQELPLPTG